MNQGRIWCVVHPTVGLPLLLGSVAITSFIVHASVMTHTTWMSNYWQGAARLRVSDAGAAAPTRAVLQSGSALSMTVTPPGAAGAAPAAFVITITPAAAAPLRVEPAATVPAPHPSATPVIHTASAG